MALLTCRLVGEVVRATVECRLPRPKELALHLQGLLQGSGRGPCVPATGVCGLVPGQVQQVSTRAAAGVSGLRAGSMGQPCARHLIGGSSQDEAGYE